MAVGRRRVAGIGVIGLGLAAAPASAHAGQPAAPALVTHTFVKALPGCRDQLRRFLELNWLAMDRRGIAAGIFTHAILLEVASVSDGAPADLADFVMVVGYLTPGGYADVEARFQEIRSQHKTILVDGRGLRQLGRITGEQQLRPIASA